MLFTDSEVDLEYFSEEYVNTKECVSSLFTSITESTHQDLDIQNMSVFDFLYVKKIRDRVLESILRTTGECEEEEEEEEEENNKILQELENLIHL